MIETIDNSIQLVVLGICTVLAFHEAFDSEKREWAILSLFYMAFFLGNLYWILFLILYGSTPFYAFIPDISWCAGYLFLVLLLFGLREGKRSIPYVLLLVPAMAFTVGMCLFYIRKGGGSFTNIGYAAFMGLILWQALAGLLPVRSREEKSSGKRGFYCTVLLFVAVEYALWTASCFWWEDTVRNPYYWIDVLLSVCFLLFLPALKKGVGR